MSPRARSTPVGRPRRVQPDPLSLLFVFGNSLILVFQTLRGLPEANCHPLDNTPPPHKKPLAARGGSGPAFRFSILGRYGKIVHYLSGGIYSSMARRVGK